MNVINHQTPTQKHERIEFVDILRGFALIGVLLMNMNAFSGHAFTIAQIPAGINRLAVILMKFLLQAKFYSLFSFLFGWGMSIQLERAEVRGTRFVPYYLRRTFILLVIGLIHAVLIWDGDILVTYALLAFLLILFRKLRPKTILLFAAACLLLSIIMVLPGETMDLVRSWYDQHISYHPQNTPSFQLYTTGTYWEVVQLRKDQVIAMTSHFLYWFGNIFSMFLLGLYVGKRGIFKNIEEHLPLIRKVMWVGLVVGLLFNGIFLKASIEPAWVPQEYNRLATSGARTIGAPALMLFYVSAIILLVRKESWKSRFDQLAPVGRMALSNYLTQSVLCTLIFYGYGLGLYGEISPTVGLILSTFIYMGQMRFSAYWLERYQFGPVEWLWRSLAYGKRQPLRQGQTYEDLQSAPLERVSVGLSKIPPKAALIGVWVILFGWAVGLVLWNQQLISLGYNEPFTIIVRVTATPEGVTVDDLVTGPEETVISTPIVEAVSYNPGQIAASGDMVSLAAAVDVNAAFTHIEELANQVYEGRYAGTAGGFAAGDYIAEQFAAYGLQPAGDDGTYFQNFPIYINQLSAVPSLIVETDDGVHWQAALYEDFSPITSRYLGDGKAYGPIFWGDQCAPDTLQENDLVGKVVLCQGTHTADEVLNTGRLALEYGASGLLLITDEETRPPDFGSRYFLPWVPETIPAFWVYPDILDEILTGTGYDLDDLLASLPPMELESSAILELEALGESACPADGCLARNVLGVIPGRDPDHADEVIIIGGHYDHMGASPDGTIWYGADDNASGIAVMLEIARSWQEQGYVPRRTVVFAAWDAEEIGLLGSTHYVENPRYALEDTIGLVQLDTVGAGAEYLTIGGDEDFQSQILLTAELLEVDAVGLDAEGSYLGTSDLTAFGDEGVPACSLSRWDEIADDHVYRTNDTPAEIDLEQLEAAAQLANLSLLNLAESEPAILAMLDQRELAAENGDRTAFLETSQLNQKTNDEIWFDDLGALDPIEVDLEAVDLQILGNTASAQVQIQVEYPDTASEDSEAESIVRTASLDVGFERGNDGWLWAGPHLVEVPEDEDIPAFRVFYPPAEEPPPDIGTSALEEYAAIAGKLGLPAEIDGCLYLLPNTEALSTNIAISFPQDLNSWISPGEIYLVFDPDLDSSELFKTAITQLVLANAGVPQSAAPWLWDGLPFSLQAEEDLQRVQSALFPDLAAALEIYPLSVSASFTTGESSSSTVEFQPAAMNQNDGYSPATSWAATDALLREYGWLGLGRVITRFGDSCNASGCLTEQDVEAAYLAALRKGSRGFETSWQNQWKASLEGVQSDLDTLLTSRMEYALAGNVEAFINTVDPSVPNLRPAEGGWVSYLIDNPPEELSLYGQPLTIYEDGRVLASINLEVQHSGHTTHLSFPILVKLTGTNPRWMGTPFEVLYGNNVTVRYPLGEESLALSVLVEAETEYSEIADTLEISPTRGLTLEIFNDPDSFRASIFYSYPLNDRTAAWTAEGENIKLYLPPELDTEDSEREYQSDLSSQIARWYLCQSGVDSEWLLKGVSSLITRSFDSGKTYQEAGAAYPQVLEKLDDETLPRLFSLSEDYLLNQAEFSVARTAALDSVRYLVETYGWDQLINIIHTYKDSGVINEVIQSALGISLTDFEREWRESLSNGHIAEEWSVFAEAFDGDEALSHINNLTRVGMNGRQAGTLGDRTAQIYIADQFAAYGLIPGGNQEGTSYFQEFDIWTSFMTAAPKLEITGNESPDFIFREDFSPLKATSGETSQVSGELVWVEDYTALEFGDVLADTIVVRPSAAEIDTEIEQAVNNGAVGIIFLGNAQDDEPFAKQPEIYAYPIDSPIQVFELTRAGTMKLVEAAGHTNQSFAKISPITHLGIFGNMVFKLPDAETAQTANVLGFLPGSDPFLKDEIIIIGAHYDHVGNDPSNGLKYSGANDDASGISGLLEIARIWHEYGYQPKRSVLFAAWGAQELGQVGSTYYVENPIYPLEDTVGMIQMDGIGGGDGFYLGIQAEWETDGQLLFRINTEDKVVITPQITPSDHFSFQDTSIPTLLINWRLANEDNLPDDFTNQVSPDRLETCVKMAIQVLMGVTR